MTNDGLLTIYDLTNTAGTGEKPVEQLVEIGTAYYSERTVGFNRLYAAAGAKRQIDKLVRIYYSIPPLTGEYVILEDGEQYRIDAVQEIKGLDVCDLTLVRLEGLLDVSKS